jgi:hypothetical protein
MQKKLVLLLIVFLVSMSDKASSHNIIFCGEVIPANNDFVANKLMNIIKKQIPNVNLPALRQRAILYFPLVQTYLRKYKIPEDFKYLPIVESGFAVLTSRVGARGFWQIMPGTAKDLGLIVNSTVDERDDITKSTIAACMLLNQYHTSIQKTHNVSSWVLTAAAYNYGIGNIFKAIKSQGKDYFSMNLNPETAVYVYKIIAVKELFEYPELYMKSFGYNVFAKKGTGNAGKQAAVEEDDVPGFADMEVVVSKKKHAVIEKPKEVYVSAHIHGKYKTFNDGDLIALQLDDDLVVKGGFTRKGSIIKGAGWMIDDKIYVDLGYGHEVTLHDNDTRKGISVEGLKKKNYAVLLKNEIYDDQAQWKK